MLRVFIDSDLDQDLICIHDSEFFEKFGIIYLTIFDFNNAIIRDKFIFVEPQFL